MSDVGLIGRQVPGTSHWLRTNIRVCTAFIETIEDYTKSTRVTEFAYVICVEKHQRITYKTTDVAATDD